MGLYRKIRVLGFNNNFTFYFVFFAAILTIMLTKVIFVNISEDVLLFFTFMILFGTLYSHVGPVVSSYLEARSTAYQEELALLLDQKVSKLEQLQALYLLYFILQSEFFNYLLLECEFILFFQVKQNEFTLSTLNGWTEVNLSSALIEDSADLNGSVDEFFIDFSVKA